MLWKEIAGMTRNKPYVVGLTGGIATGKSTASAIIRKFGYLVIDADEIARHILEPGKIGSLLVAHEFPTVIDVSGEIDRKSLGDIIFSDDKLRNKLDSLLHPLISEEIVRRLNLHCDQEVVFIDIPLLFEVKGNMEEEGVYFDEIWLVYANRNIQLGRLRKRNLINEVEAVKRVDSQMDIELKKDLSDVVIDNMGSKEQLEAQIYSLLNEMSGRITSKGSTEGLNPDLEEGNYEKY